MAIDVGTLEATLKLVDELSPATADMDAAIAEFERTLGATEGTVRAYQQELAGAAEISQKLQEQAAALGLTYDDVAELVNRQTNELNAQAEAMDRAHEEALLLNDSYGRVGAGAESGAEKVTKLINAFRSGSIKDFIGAFMELPAVWAAALAGAGQVAAAFKNLAAEAEQLSNKALVTGLSVEGVQAFRRLGEEAGVGAGAVENAIVRMQRIAEGNGKAFKKLGVDMKEYFGKDTEGQFNLIAGKIAELGTASERTAALTSVFGRGMATQLMPVINELAENGMPKLVALTREQVDALGETDNAIDHAGGAWGDLKNQLLAIINELPIKQFFEGIAGVLRDVAKYIRDSVIPAIHELKAEWLEIFNMMNQKAYEQQTKYIQLLSFIKNAKDQDAALRQALGGGAVGGVRADNAMMAELEQMRLGRKTADELIGAHQKLADQYHKTGEAQSKAAEETRNGTAALDSQKPAVRANTAALAEWEKKALAVYRTMESARKSLEAGKSSTMGSVLGFPTPEELKKQVAEVDAAAQAASIAAAKRFQGPSQWTLAGENVRKLIAQGFGDESILKKLLAGAPEIGAEAGRKLIDGIRKETGKAAPTVALEFGKGLKASLKDLPQVIIGAIQGGGDVFKAIGAKLGGDIMGNLFKEGGGPAKFLTDKLGKTLGSAIGSLAGPLGSMVGSVLGKGLSALAGKLGIGGNKVIMQVNDMRDAFFKAQGGFENFSKKMAAVSNEDWAKKIFNAKTVEEFNSLVTEAQRLLGLQGEAQQKVTDAMDRYGITIDQMGPKFAQQELDKKAASLYEDYLLLTQAGADHNLVIEKMGPALNEYVNQAVKAGATIPEAMKPTIDALYEQGKLLHEDGTAYTQAEYEALKYGKSQEEMFDSLLKKITELVNALLGIPNVNNTVTTTHVNRYTNEGGGGGGGRPEDDVPMAVGGIITRSTRILAGEAGREAIIPLDQAGGVLGGGMSGDDMRAAIQQQTRELSKVFRDAVLQARG